MAERRIADIGPLLEDLKKELKDLEGSTEALTVEEAAEDEIEELKSLPVVTKEGSIFSIVATVPVFAYVTLSDLRCKKMAINKKIREAVYQKYGGRCAYCGRAIAYKDMQVDHFRPLRVWNEADGAADDISNLMPACRMCNHYKRANSLEVFRRYIAEIPRKLRDNYIYKIGVAYRNIIENEKPIKFFFETEEAKTNPEYAITSPEEMARYLMGFCRCRLATGNGCPGCPFDKPTSDNGDGECRLYVPDDWDF